MGLGGAGVLPVTRRDTATAVGKTMADATHAVSRQTSFKVNGKARSRLQVAWWIGIGHRCGGAATKVAAGRVRW